MKAIQFRVSLVEPTLVGSLDGDPNSTTSLDYLPGSVLRGAILRLYLARQGKGPRDRFDPGDREVRRLFFSGETRYLNGYPGAGGVRTLPVPLSWQQRKGDDTEIADFAVAEPTGDGPWESVGKPFCVVDGDEATLVRPARHVAVHTTRTRRFGRAMAAGLRSDDLPGAIYRYDALAAGQQLAAAILCEQDEDVSKSGFRTMIVYGKLNGRPESGLASSGPG